MKVIFCDNDIIVCHKERGELSECADESAKDSLPRQLGDYLAENGQKNTHVFAVHRLDRETEGVMVYARNSRAAAALSKSICEGKLQKTYLALCHGEVFPDSDHLCDLLYYDRKRGKSFVVTRERNGVRKAELDYKVIERKNGFSLLEIKLITGRTHQIRVQFASRKHPLVADRRYGAPKSEHEQLGLLAKTLTFPHPTTNKVVAFECDIEALSALTIKD